MTNITIEVDSKSYVVEGELLPPVGTWITVDGHLTGDGGNATHIVTAHLWNLPFSGRQDGVSELGVWVRTRKLSQEEITQSPKLMAYPSPEDRPPQHWADRALGPE